MLHRHHPLLQAGEKNQDGGVLELFYVFPYFCILFIIAREKSHFVDFVAPPLPPPTFPLLFLHCHHPILQAGWKESFLGCCASPPYFFIVTIICFK